MKITIISIMILCFSLVFVTSIDTLRKSDFLTGNQTLISAGGKFELGFFCKGIPKKYYVGIWYKDIPSKNITVWVANRDRPSYNKSSLVFKLGNNSDIVLLEGSQIVWKTIHGNGKTPVLQLLDSGNLVIREDEDSNLKSSDNNFIWESFNNPTDTLIEGQKLGWDFKTGINRVLRSWVSPEDPSTGNYSFNLDYHGDPEFYFKDGDQIMYRTGPWVGYGFSGVPEMKRASSTFIFNFHTSPDEVSYTVDLPPNSKAKSRLMASPQGRVVRWIWVPETRRWDKYWFSGKDGCDTYRVCGPNGVCNVSALFECQCPHGFEAKDPGAWDLRDWTGGCVRKNKLDCKTDGFSSIDNMKFPETTTAYVDASLSLPQCEDLCKRNCSCTAYSNSKFFNGIGSGCVIWTDNLIDLRYFAVGGEILYIRLSASDLEINSASNKARNVEIGVGVSVLAAIILAGLTTFIIVWKRKYMRHSDPEVTTTSTRGRRVERSREILLNVESSRKGENSGEPNNGDDLELPLFDLHTMATATDNFCDANKLGYGGFGHVYKGVMVDGQEVAIKRLSKDSGQGAEEFKNEVRLIAKLQHRNLVRLLGCCVELDEKMLVYEYLENRSLDSILFYKEKCSLLDWQTRFYIICGIARGLVYLHQDSRYRIIHRDLKASNVLLDRDMNPKISDFGMAKIFGGDETEGNTRRVVGTYGYMAPEYAMDGLFSIKSDVFSFGVLVLEILSGIKNRGFYNSDHDLNLLGYSWKQWREGKGTEMVDKSIGDGYTETEVLRCIQVGLLCVQERPEDRPTMGGVVLMLSSENPNLDEPKIPGFCIGWKYPNETSSSSSNNNHNRHDESFTLNQVTLTMLNAR